MTLWPSVTSFGLNSILSQELCLFITYLLSRYPLNSVEDFISIYKEARYLPLPLPSLTSFPQRLHQLIFHMEKGQKNQEHRIQKFLTLKRVSKFSWHFFNIGL